VSAPYSPFGQQDGCPPQGDQQPGYQGYYPPPGSWRRGGYLKGGPVDFRTAIRLQLRYVITFTGRASLSAYWWFALALFVIGLAGEVLTLAVGSAAFTALITLVLIVAGLSGLSAGVRRLHDTGKTGWLLLLGLVPFVGTIIVIVLLVMPATPGQNRYG
jgi:uncharacterized membrane protein YhaH (DUF805 family)